MLVAGGIVAGLAILRGVLIEVVAGGILGVPKMLPPLLTAVAAGWTVGVPKILPVLSTMVVASENENVAGPKMLLELLVGLSGPSCGVVSSDIVYALTEYQW
jgi:hypothetical protein